MADRFSDKEWNELIGASRVASAAPRAVKAAYIPPAGLPVDVTNENAFLTFVQGNLQTMQSVAAQLSGGVDSVQKAQAYMEYLAQEPQQLLQVILARQQYVESQASSLAAQKKSQHRAM